LLSIYSTIYDRRITNLSAAIECLLINPVRVPAHAYNTYSFSATYIKDDIELMRPARSDEYCWSVWQQALALEDPDYTSYSMKITSTQVTNGNYCSEALESATFCPVVSTLRVDSFMVDTKESVRGVEYFDIWLNVAAIVGGVQFLAWCAQVIVNDMIGAGGKEDEKED